jgi:hypothetical protein
MKSSSDLEMLQYIKRLQNHVNLNVQNHTSASMTTNLAHRLSIMANNSLRADTNQHIEKSPTDDSLHLPSTHAYIDLPNHNISRPYLSTKAMNRRPLLYFPTDDEFLSQQQIFIRKQIEFFESSIDDVGKTTSGRKHPTMLDQVGIQCRHCVSLSLQYRERGAVSFPAKLIGIYQASQNMAASHMIQYCHHIDNDTRRKLVIYKQCRPTIGHGGKKYWAETARAQGVIDSESGSGLRFQTSDTIAKYR